MAARRSGETDKAPPRSISIIYEKEFIVQDLKTRLDKYLAGQLKDTSHSQIQRDIEAGLVLVNGVVIKVTKFVVRLDDKIVYQPSTNNQQQSAIQATNTPLKVLYNNHDLLIIDKPAGMVVHPGRDLKVKLWPRLYYIIFGYRYSR